MVSKPPPYPFKNFTMKQSLKHHIKAKNKGAFFNAPHRLKQPLPDTHK